MAVITFPAINFPAELPLIPCLEQGLIETAGIIIDAKSGVSGAGRAPKEGMVVGSEDGITVVLDSTITDELLREGLARELVNRVQNLRKSAGLEVSDRIRLRASCGADTKLAATLADAGLSALLCAETLAEDIAVLGESDEHLANTATDEIEGESVTLSLEAIQ